MLAEGIAFVALRKRTLYDAQVPTKRDSPVHQRGALKDLLARFRVRELMSTAKKYVEFQPQTKAQDMLHFAGTADPHQDIFPVRDSSSAPLKGIITSEALRTLAGDPLLQTWVMATDLMQRPVSVRPEDDVAAAARAMLQAELRELPVIDAEGKIVGFLDEADIARVYLQGAVPKQPMAAGSPDDTWQSRERRARGPTKRATPRGGVKKSRVESRESRVQSRMRDRRARAPTLSSRLSTLDSRLLSTSSLDPLQLLERLRPVLLQQPRQRAVGQ